MEGRCQAGVRRSIIFLFYYLLAQPCFADDPCAGTPPQVATLNRTVPLAAPSAQDFCQGEFRVDPVKDSTGREEATAVSFWIDGKEAFKEVIRTGFVVGEGGTEVGVVHSLGCTGLLISSTSGGAGGGITCSDLLVPHRRTFKAIKLEASLPVEVKDLNGDGKGEVLMPKLELGYECVPGAYRQYWTTVYHFDPGKGHLVDVSTQFPEFYARRARDYQKALQEIERMIKLSPRCRARLQDLIGKARRLAVLPTPVRSAATAASLNLFARRGDINDFAGMLSEAEQRQLVPILESVKKDTSTELVIVTIPSYRPGRSLRQYAQALMQAWEIGREKKQRGVMVILAQKEREVWVATQPEVKALLTEDICNTILRDTMLPSLRKGAYGRSLFDGIIQIRGVLRGDRRGKEPTSYQVEDDRNLSGALGHHRTRGGLGVATEDSRTSLPVVPARDFPTNDDIQNVDFRNFAYNVRNTSCAEMLGKTVVQVQDGEYKKEGDPDFGFGIAADRIFYGDLTGDGHDEAVVMTYCGGMHPVEQAFIYTMRDGHPSLLTKLEEGGRAMGGII